MPHREQGSENEFFGLSDQRAMTYGERDVPANQWFHNLEEAIKKATSNWQSMSFEQKVQGSMGVATYLRSMRDLLKQHGIDLVGVDKLSPQGLNALESLHNRQVLETMVNDTIRFIEKLRLGKELAKTAFQAYQDLVDYDPRVNPIRREELKNTLRAQAHMEIMQMVSNVGGRDSYQGAVYALDEASRLGQPVAQLEAVSGQYIVRHPKIIVDDALIQTFIINYTKLDLIFRLLRWKEQQERRELASIEQELRERGGPLKPHEQQRLGQFEGGRDPDRNLNIYTSYLDYLRATYEILLRHGFPGRGKKLF